MTKKFRCLVCGYIHEGENAPEECPLCHVGPEDFEELAEAEGKADARRAGLEALLGETLPDKVNLVLTSDREYCRNCRHFIEHPFCMRCGKNGCAVDPMGSCSGFEERH